MRRTLAATLVTLAGTLGGCGGPVKGPAGPPPEYEEPSGATPGTAPSAPRAQPSTLGALDGGTDASDVTRTP